MNLPLVPPKRCAVYCRVSSDERLDQPFNSIDAQREAGHAYIHSQRAEGWIRVADHFEDGGYSGGNMERPALRRLLADIEHGKVDVVVVYKIDRLSRSLSDFARMVEVFDRRGVSFVSVTQQFNTTTSMGRLMLNVLAPFHGQRTAAPDAAGAGHREGDICWATAPVHEPAVVPAQPVAGGLDGATCGRGAVRYLTGGRG